MHYIINNSYRPDAPVGPRSIEKTATDFHDELFRVFTDRLTGKEMKIPVSEIREFETRL